MAQCIKRQKEDASSNLAQDLVSSFFSSFFSELEIMSFFFCVSTKVLTLKKIICVYIYISNRVSLNTEAYRNIA